MKVELRKLAKYLDSNSSKKVQARLISILKSAGVTNAEGWEDLLAEFEEYEDTDEMDLSSRLKLQTQDLGDWENVLRDLEDDDVEVYEEDLPLEDEPTEIGPSDDEFEIIEKKKDVGVFKGELGEGKYVWRLRQPLLDKDHFEHNLIIVDTTEPKIVKVVPFGAPDLVLKTLPKNELLDYSEELPEELVR